MFQRWSELLFLHWRFDRSKIQATLPPGLAVDTFDGSAWLGVVPFQMERVRPRFLPSIPSLSNFPELNLRTYVVDQNGRPGVWFYSLDTPQPLANWIARNLFHLNYRRARFSISSFSGSCQYTAELKSSGGWNEKQNYSWRRKGGVRPAEPGSLEFFLVERYRLFAYDWSKARLYSGRVHHKPYPVEDADLISASNFLFGSNGLEAPQSHPDHVLASAGVDVEVFPLGSVQVSADVSA